MKDRIKHKNRIIGLAVVLVMAGGYWGTMEVLDRSLWLNDEVVDPGRLIRSAQPYAGDLDRIKEEEGLGTIICLRGDEKDEVAEWALKNGVKVVCLKMKADDPPTPAQLELFFDIMSGHTVRLDKYKGVISETLGAQGEAVEFPLPALIHCEGGADRTGVMVALYRMAFQGWDLDSAKQDMIGHFHFPFQHPDQFRFLEEQAESLRQEYESKNAAKKDAEKGQ